MSAAKSPVANDINYLRSIDLNTTRKSSVQARLRYLPAVVLGLGIGVTGSLPAFLSAAAVLTIVAYWLLPLVSGNSRATAEELIEEIVSRFGGWNVVLTTLGISSFISLVMFGSPAFALLDNARAAADDSVGEQLGEGSVEFFFGGLLVIFFFVIAGALLVGGIQVARSENPGTFFLTAFVFALILGALEFFDKIMFTDGAATPAT